ETLRHVQRLVTSRGERAPCGQGGAGERGADALHRRPTLHAGADVARRAVDEERGHARLALETRRGLAHEVSRELEVAVTERSPVYRVVPDESERAAVEARDLEDAELRIERQIEPARGDARDRRLARHHPRGRAALRWRAGGPLHGVGESPAHRRRLAIGGEESPEGGVREGAGTRVSVAGRDAHHAR